MLIKKIVDTVNRGYVASDYLRQPDIYYYMDMVIDDINDSLNSIYPTFTDWEDFVEEWNNNPDNVANIKDRTNYDVLPDKYLRKVVALGTALKFYERDEEGNAVAEGYQQRYQEALFKMQRDYHHLVPGVFRDDEGGFIDMAYNREEGPEDLVPRGVVMHGTNSRIL